MADLVRRMAEADIAAAAAVRAEAFGEDPADVVRRFHDGPRYTWRNGWVVELDGEIRAVAVALPLTWWYQGVSYPVSGIAGVATRAVDRRRGFASQLVRTLLQAEQAGERCVSLLYPFRHGYYRRLGYATVGLTHFYRLPTAQLPDDPELRRAVRPVREADRQAIQALYRQSLTTGAGGLERNPGHWALRWARQDERWVAYADEEGIQGYLAYRTDGPQLEVRELVALSGRAERGVWAFLAAQAEQRQSITYHAPTERPLWASLAEPPMVEAANRGFVLTDAAGLTVGLMARLVDVAEALRRRRFDPQLAGSWTMQLTDPVLDGAPKVLSVTLEGGQARVEAGGGRPAVACDVATLSQLFCGVVRASDARWYGRLRADDDEAPRLLDRAFTGPGPFVYPGDWF